MHRSINTERTFAFHAHGRTRLNDDNLKSARVSDTRMDASSWPVVKFQSFSTALTPTFPERDTSRTDFGLVGVIFYDEICGRQRMGVWLFFSW